MNGCVCGRTVGTTEERLARVLRAVSSVRTAYVAQFAQHNCINRADLLDCVHSCLSACEPLSLCATLFLF